MEELKMTHTKAALEKYDAFDKAQRKKWQDADTSAKIDPLLVELGKQRRLVALAFWEDTKDRNSKATCLQCISPEDPWLRQLVAKYG